MRTGLFLATALAVLLGASFASSSVTALVETTPVTNAGTEPVPIAAAGNAFASPAVVVPAGTTIRWDGLLLPHTVTTSDDAVGAATGAANDRTNADGDADTFNRALPQGSSYSHTFLEPGEYSYYCEIHRQLGMVGTIVVV